MEEAVRIERAEVAVAVEGDCPRLRAAVAELDEICRAEALRDVLRLEIGGKLAPVDSLEAVSTSGGTLHVLAIDTSSLNMWRWTPPGGGVGGFGRPSLKVARDLAARYVEEIALADPEASVVIVTFGDELAWIEGPARDRERLIRAIRRIPAGYESRAYDGLWPLLRWLQQREERKIVVAITGMSDAHVSDGSGPSFRTAESVGGLLARLGSGDTLLFHIDLWLASSQWRGDPRAERPAGPPIRLEGATSDSGGESTRIDHPSAIDAVLARIRAALRRETYRLVFTPPALPGGSGSPWKEARLESLEPACRLRQIGTGSFVGRNGAERDEVEWVASRTVERHDDDGNLIEARRLAKVYRSAASRSALVGWDVRCGVPSAPGDGAALPGEFLRVHPPSIELCLRDEVRGNGLLEDDDDESGLPSAPDTAWPLPDGTRLIFRSRPSWGIRHVAIEIPSIADLARDDAGPGSLLFRWAMGAASAESLDHGPPAVSGNSFFEVLPHLSRAMFDFLPEYRLWAVARTRSSLSPDDRQALESMPDVPLREAWIEARARRSAPRWLGAWLGDTSLRDAMIGMETAAAAALPLLDVLQRAEAVRRVERAWSVLRARWERTDRNRSVAILMPAFDRRRGEVGFHRLLLPRPAWRAIRSGAAGFDAEIRSLPDDSIPPEPTGLRLLARLLEQPDSAALLSNRSVRSIRHEPDRRGWTGVALEIGRGGAAEVEIELRVDTPPARRGATRPPRIRARETSRAARDDAAQLRAAMLEALARPDSAAGLRDIGGGDSDVSRAVRLAGRSPPRAEPASHSSPP